MIGDLNEITWHNEKKEGMRRFNSLLLPFKQMLSDCGILEFSCYGYIMSRIGKRG